MFVLVEEATESITSADAKLRDDVRIGDRFGERVQGPGVGDPTVGPVRVEVPFVLVRGVRQMRLVPDQRAVQQLTAAAVDPPLHDRVHPGYLDATEHDPDPGVGEDHVEQGRIPAVAVADAEASPTTSVLRVHGQVRHGLGHPGAGWVRGSAEDPNPSGGLLDDGQDVQAGPGQRHGFEEVGSEDGLGLRVRERRPGGRGPLRCWVDSGLMQDLPDRGCGDLDAR